MARWMRIAIALAGVLVLAIVLGAFALYRATQSVPEFYQQAIAADPVRQKAASDKMVKNVAGLTSDIQQKGAWQAIFTEDEINGWLAIDLVKNHGHLVPGEVEQPRVAIAPDGITLAFRYRHDGRETVISATVDAYLIKPNVLGLRLRRARAGLLPLPLDELTQHLSKIADQLEWEIAWRQAEGDPVAEVTIPPLRDKRGRRVQVEVLRLEDRRVVVAGVTS